jgi:hypothetical protein
VPKKNNTIQAESSGGAPPQADGSPAETKIKKTPAARRTSTPKSATARKKAATAGKAKASRPPGAGKGAELQDEKIRLRAYFISERRRRFGLPGDAESDWLEAKRQLLSEADLS